MGLDIAMGAPTFSIGTAGPPTSRRGLSTIPTIRAPSRRCRRGVTALCSMQMPARHIGIPSLEKCVQLLRQLAVAGQLPALMYGAVGFRGPPVRRCPTLRIRVAQLLGVHAVPSRQSFCTAIPGFKTRHSCRYIHLPPTFTLQGGHLSGPGYTGQQQRGPPTRGRPRAGRGVKHRYALGPPCVRVRPLSQGAVYRLTG